MPKPRFRLAVLFFLLCPVLITFWFVQDSGLANGLNRLFYELSMGLFFLAYGLLLALIASVLRYRQRACPKLVRLSGISLATCAVWTLATVLSEQ